MTINEFINEYVGKALHNDYGAQCVLLVKTFSGDVLGENLGYFGGSALAGWGNKFNTFPKSKWTKIENTIEAVPEPGSIIFFKGEGFSQEYGHVGVVVEADKNNVKVLEQNAGAGTGTGLGDDAIRIHTYPLYHGVIGWYTLIDNLETEDKEELNELLFKNKLEEYSIGNIVVLYNGKYYINHNNTRIKIDENNYSKYL